MSVFSAKYRPLAKEAFVCVFRTITLKPCDTGLDDRIKAELVSFLIRPFPAGARFLNRHFLLLSWVFVLLSVASFAYLGYGLYNFYYYGNCEGSENSGACILNDLTGDYGRFSEPRDLIKPTEFGGISEGNPDADIKIVEFGCFTCPYTKESEPAVKKLIETYNDSVYYVFKPFPLPNHENSYDVAIGVLCAAEQDKQWELREAVFRQQELCVEEGEIAIKQLAEDAGLNMAEFNECYDNKQTAEQLDRYIEQAKDSHIYATPTFFVNANVLVGPQPFEEFEKLIEEEKTS